MVQQFIPWVERLGWRSDSSGWYGEYKGYLFNSADFSVFSTIYPRLDDTSKDMLERYLRDNKESLGLEGYRVTPRQLVVSLKSESDPVAAVEALLDKLTEKLAELQIQGHGYCSNCGRSGEFTPAFLNEQALYMCDDCYQKATGEILAASSQASTGANYGKGAIGALLAGLIGIIPWLIIDRLGYIAAIAGYLIGRAALWGYGKAGGRVGSMTRWIILGVTVVCVVTANLVSLGMVIHDNDIPVTFEVFRFLFTIPELKMEFLKNLAIGLGLSLLGIWGILTGLKGHVDSSQPTLRRPAAA